MKRRRIAIVTTSYPRWEGDPSGHFVQTEARALGGQGDSVTVITSGATRGDQDAREPAGLRILRIDDRGSCGWPGVVPRLRQDPRRMLGLIRWTLQARRILRQEGPFDRVIAHWLIPAAFPIALCAESAELEVVVHGSDARLLAALPHTASKAILRWLIQRNWEFRCVSVELRDLIQELAEPHRNPRLRVAPSPLAVDGAWDPAAAREQLKIAKEIRLAVIVGRLIAEKRVREALQALRLVPEIAVAVVGDGPERQALEAGFPGVRFVGQVDHRVALQWIAAADVVLSASRHEGSPTALREARALKVPVIASPAGDLVRWAERDSGLFLVG